ncbi:FAD-dependent oxidoreductase [Legionella sp. km772]|uniref:FAD-dependent oxidoreductase n=1 Tax=Legionella sp. km772 TaxID=2498111 RepID=UPI0013156EB3|nr:FAD-dependent oxidoreductase [Legionella sp. km772]
MKHTVIIGAGPMGLYLAYKLHQAKVKHIVIYDPRTGEYVRPGHVNSAHFRKLDRALGKSSLSSSFGHIKDFERKLFKEISDLGIPAEKKEFVRFNEGAKKSIVVKNSDGDEEIIECDYVFDCTGSQRTLVNTMNHLITPAPFTLKPIKENVVIKQHLLAYVRMSEEDLDRIPAFGIMNQPDYFLTAEQHIKAVNRMRVLGWQDFGLPQLYGIYFGKGKVCLYMECPDNLPRSAYEDWVKIALDVSTNSTDITFSQLPPSRKYKSKPRLSSFIVNPGELEQAAFTSKKYPTLIPIGDAQTEPHYGLAQGITDGMDRVDAFMDHIEVLDGNIAYFDTDEYHEAIRKMMKSHKESIIDKYQRRDEYSYKMLQLAKTNYTEALTAAKGSSAETELTALVKEINARLAYQDALKLRVSLLIDGKEELSSSKHSTDVLVSKLIELAGLCIHAYENLPITFNADKIKSFTMFKHCAAHLKECGNRYVKAGNNLKAIDAYQEALKLYRYPGLELSLEQTTIQSNIVITYRKLNNHEAAIALGGMALSNTPKTTDFADIRKKLLYNVLKSFQTTIQAISADKVLEISLEKQKAILLLDTHPNLLELSSYTDFCSFFGKVVEPVSLSAAVPKPRHTSSNPATFLSGLTPDSLSEASDLNPVFIDSGCRIS